MLVERLDQPPADLERRTGWTVKPEGACRGDVCVPLPAPFDVAELAARLRMALVADERHGLWALGPESGGHALDLRQASRDRRCPTATVATSSCDRCAGRR